MRLARKASPYTAQQLAEAIGRESAQSIYDYETPNKPDRPSIEALGIISKRTGKSLKWLVYGEDDDAGESDFINTLRGIEQDLSPQRRRELERTALMMVEEDKRVDPFSLIEQQMIQAGFPAAQVAQAVQRARATAQESTAADDADAPREGQGA